MSNKAPSSEFLRHSVRHFFAKIAAAHGDRIALECGDRAITYRELDTETTRIAARLRQMGVVNGQLVGFFLDRSIDAVFVILGILKAGAAYVPFDTSYPANLLRYICEDSAPHLVVFERRLCETRGIEPFWNCDAVALDDLFATPTTAIEDLPAKPIGGDDLAYVMYTSGSTGRPKGALIPHRGIVRLTVGGDFADFGPDQVFLQLAPLSFDASTFEIWGALLHGAKLAILSTPHPSLDEIADAIRRHGVTTMWLTAGLFHLMVDHNLDGLRPLKQLLVGGDVLSPPHIDKVLRAIPSCRLINGYGPTENTTFTCCYTIPKDGLKGRSVPIGTAIAHTEIHVLDDAMRPVPDGEEGELLTGGAGLALGYLNRPDLTAEKFVPHPAEAGSGERLYRTGDRVRRLPDGNLEFLGRVDRQIKVNGKRLELDEIESLLRRLPDIRDAAVVSHDDDSGTRKVAAFVVADPGSSLQPDAVREALRKELPDFMVPARIIRLDAFPLSPVGKVDRGKLAALAAEDAAKSAKIETGPSQPTAGTEDALLQLWRRILQRNDIGINDNFFDLGGTSLQMIKVHAALKEMFAKPVAIVDLFNYPKIKTLAAWIDGGPAKTPVLSAAERSRQRMAALERARPAYRRGPS